MRNFLIFLAYLLGAFLTGVLIAQAVSILTVPQGGSGQGYFASSTPLVGSGINGLIATTTLRVDYIHATSTTATSTFEGGVKTNLLQVTSGTASSTFTGGIVVAGGVKLSTYNCSTYASGGKITTDANGYLTCGDASAGGGITSLNGLSGSSQTFSAINIPLASLRYTTLTISSSGTTHNFITEASSSPTFGNIVATSTLGIATSSPGQTLSVNGNINFDTQIINIGTTSSATTSINYFAVSTTTIPNSIINAFSIATSTRKGTGQSIPILSFDTSNSRVGIATSQPSTSFSVNGPIFADGAIGIGRVTTTQGMLEVASNTLISGILNVGNVATSTFQSGVQANLLNIIGNASSTFTGGVVIGGGVKLSAYNCAQYSNGGRLTTDTNGYLNCGAGSAGGITTLNGLVADPQTFSALLAPLANGRYTTLTISSAGSVHSFSSEASSSPTFGFLNATTTLAVGTTSPKQILSIGGGDIDFDVQNINIGSSSSATTSINYFGSATTTIPNNLINAFSIATSTRKGTLSAVPILTFDTSNSRVGVATSQPSTAFSVNGPVFIDGGLGIGTVTTTPGILEVATDTLVKGILNVSGGANNATSTFKNGLQASLLNLTTSNASSTLAGGIVIAGGVRINSYNCSQYGSGGKLSTDANGYLVCGADTGGSGSPGGNDRAVQFNSATTFGGDETQFAWENTNKRLGIASSSPVAQFSIDTNTNPYAVWIGDQGKADASSTALFAITGSGNVLIGTSTGTSTPPNTWKLQVASTSPFIAISDTDAPADQKHWTLSSNSGSFIIASATDALATTSNISALTITNLGRFGIASSTPAGQFSLAPSIIPYTVWVGKQGSSSPSFLIENSGIVAIGTSSPSKTYYLYASSTGLGFNMATTSYAFDLQGSAYFDSSLITYGSSSAPNLTMNYQAAATNTIISGLTAWSIATTTRGNPIMKFDTPSGVRATTTIFGGLILDTGNVSYDSSSGIITADQLTSGPLQFDTDAGAVNWIDMPTSAAIQNTVESYTAQVGGVNVLTIYGEINKTGVIATTSVGIGTTTPKWLLQIASTSPAFAISDTDAALNKKHWILSANNNVFGLATATDAFATSSIYSFTIDTNGKVGIATTAQKEQLSVHGHIQSGGRSPLVSSCGTAPSIVGSDGAGKVTIGTGVTTACTLTFNTPWQNPPACTILADSGTLTYTGTTNTTSFTFNSSATMASEVIMYTCIGW